MSFMRSSLVSCSFLLVENLRASSRSVFGYWKIICSAGKLDHFVEHARPYGNMTYGDQVFFLKMQLSLFSSLLSSTLPFIHR